MPSFYDYYTPEERKRMRDEILADLNAVDETAPPEAKKSRMPAIITFAAIAWLASWAATIWWAIPLMLSICTGGVW